MKFAIIKFSLIIQLLFVVFDTYATENENDRIRFKGTVLDKNTQEILIGATVYVQELKTGTATDVYGNFSVRIPSGKYTLKISYIGYKTSIETVEIFAEISKTFYLEKDSRTLEDVLVNAKRTDENVTRTEMSVEKMKIQEIRQIPALMGEVDIIKALVLLPRI